MRVNVHLLRAHGQAYHAMKNLDPKAHIGWAQHLRVYSPKNRFSPSDRWGAWVADEVMNWSWYRTIQTGKININVPFIFKANEESPECLGAMDFLGFNYYSRDLISVKLWTKQKFHIDVPKNCIKTDMNWEIYPEGMTYLLHQMKLRKLGHYPLVVTENGIADAKDRYRKDFIYQHLKNFLEGCEKFSLKPKGFLYWSLIDNFEWIDGFGPRFGLFEMNYATQERVPRPSAHYFKEMGRLQSLVPPEGS
jgi:beta-glucosidase